MEFEGGHGAGGDAAAAGAVGEMVGPDVVIASRGVVDSVAADGVLAAVEERVCANVLWGGGPVPIGLVAFVAALVAQGGFVEVEEVAVPGQKDGIEVDAKGLVDVHGGEIVTTVDGARDFARRDDGGLVGKAENRGDVVRTLMKGERGPFLAEERGFERCREGGNGLERNGDSCEDGNGQHHGGSLESLGGTGLRKGHSVTRRPIAMMMGQDEFICLGPSALRGMEQCRTFL